MPGETLIKIEVMAEIKCWDHPPLAKSFEAEYGKYNLMELINYHPHVVKWHVQNAGWQLSPDAKDDYNRRMKMKAIADSTFAGRRGKGAKEYFK